MNERVDRYFYSIIQSSVLLLHFPGGYNNCDYLKCIQYSCNILYYLITIALFYFPSLYLSHTHTIVPSKLPVKNLLLYRIISKSHSHLTKVLLLRFYSATQIALNIQETQFFSVRHQFSCSTHSYETISRWLKHQFPLQFQRKCKMLSGFDAFHSTYFINIFESSCVQCNCACV